MTITELGRGAAPVRVDRLARQGGNVTCSRTEGCGVVKMYVGIRPDGGGSLESQSLQIYQRLADLLAEQGASRHDVVTEKVFFSDIANQVAPFGAVREHFHTSGNGSLPALPATTYLQQPSCEPGVLCELQARVFMATDEQELTVTAIDGLPAPAAGRIVSCRGYDHIYLQNLTGGAPGDGLDYAAQTAAMFDMAEAVLQDQDLTFRDVIRTWIYVDEMERDYAALNSVRSTFFERVGVKRLPASTGIQGGVYPCDRGGSMDVYALRTQRPVDIALMHASSLNEAWVYGSAFSRGMTVTRDDRRVAYVSGTASIDDRGDVVHIGDLENQVHRMLHNVERLLAGSGAKPADVVRATTYLKDGEGLDILRRVYAEHGFPTDIPHTVCCADVCRPDWLVEIEAAAIYPPPQDD
jgi:enamine deaminase RidA (YjgF/YER057c/UK114 family)